MALETKGSRIGRRILDRPYIGAEAGAVSDIQGLGYMFVNHASFEVPGVSTHFAPRPGGHDRPLLSHPLQKRLDELALLFLDQSS